MAKYTDKENLYFIFKNPQTVEMFFNFLIENKRFCFSAILLILGIILVIIALYFMDIYIFIGGLFVLWLSTKSLDKTEKKDKKDHA